MAAIEDMASHKTFISKKDRLARSKDYELQLFCLYCAFEYSQDWHQNQLLSKVLRSRLLDVYKQSLNNHLPKIF